MAAAIDLVKLLERAEVKEVSSRTPEAMKLIASTMTPDLLERLAQPPKRLQKGQGKGGNTNYAESVLIPAFRALRLKGTEFHPNGSQRPPDVLLGGEHEVEWKSVGSLRGNLAFNDSIPSPWIHYCLYARRARRALAIGGDILLLSLDSRLVSDVHEHVRAARRRGMTKKEEGLAYFYPRQNLFIRNFLHAAPANGYYDFDRNTIWVPNA